jgi:NAD(P)-dependent dehydrogenase (short-subunit alcohol dehydrogenase family)
MDLELIGKRALVTGGSKGIGRAIARQLALEGCDVVIVARGEAALKSAAKDLTEETGRKIVPIAGDTGKDEDVRAMVAGTVAAFGGIDIVVNNAAEAGGPSPKLADITDELLLEQVNTKVLGYVRTAREAAPHMAKNGWGRIINIAGLMTRSSGNAIGSIRNASVAALTKNLADELGPLGITVTVVHPGLTRTEGLDALLDRNAKSSGLDRAELEKQFGQRNCIRRLIDAQEVADVVTFLASPRSGSITGDAIACGGGTPGVIHY